MMTKTIWTSAIAAAILLSGCGTGSDEGTSSTILSGVVADGYLVGAKVCLDRDDSMSCDSDEPFAITTAGGRFSMSVDGSTAYPYFVEVGADVIDEDDNQSVRRAFTLGAPAGETFISPISTLVHAKMRAGASKAQARASVASALGITNAQLLYADYIASADTEANDVHEKAKIVVELKKQLAMNIESSYESGIIEEYINTKVMQELSSINTTYNSSVDNATNLAAYLLTNINLGNYTSELEELKNAKESNLEPQTPTEPSTNTNTIELTSSTTIEKNQHYRYTYAGGTDLKRFTIGDSVGDICTFHRLDSTVVYNPYSETAFMVNGSDEPSVLSLTPSAGENSSFVLAWMYYTTTTSFVDFYVSCQ